MLEFAKYIEQTRLNPTLTQTEVDILIGESLDAGFHGICLPPFWVKRARREIGNQALQLVTVIGFPLGYQMTEVKLKEIDQAIEDGANELDMVINLSAFKSNHPWTKIELAKCATRAHQHSVLLKAIVETAYLSANELDELCKYCADAGVDFVKTSTGFAPTGATTENIKRMRKILPPYVGIKASGGIKTLPQAVEMIKAGADRIGTSSGINILAELKSQQQQ